LLSFPNQYKYYTADRLRLQDKKNRLDTRLIAHYNWRNRHAKDFALDLALARNPQDFALDLALAQRANTFGLYLYPKSTHF
jgi:hypothetical protein